MRKILNIPKFIFLEIKFMFLIRTINRNTYFKIYTLTITNKIHYNITHVKISKNIFY